MTIRDFAPRPMKLSVLTAAFQELTPRDRRDPDPDLAIEEWLEFARDIGRRTFSCLPRCIPR